MNMDTLMLLRPWWLLALLPLALVWWWIRRHGGRRGDAWHTAVDAHLLPHLLIQASASGGRSVRWVRCLLPLLAILAVLALSGPSWRALPVPLEQTAAPLVLAVDLSSSIRTADLKPSRLAQVRAKLRQLIAGREGGQLGLVVFADDAYSAAPITRDAHTLDNMLDALAPEVMPVDGHRPDRAIARAVELLAKAGFQGGDILLLTDHSDTRAEAAAAEARSRGFRVSALGLGTPAGAPLASARGFVTDANGQVRLARLDAPTLATLATAGGGRYATLARDESDLRALGVLSASGSGVLRRSTEAGLDLQLSRSDDGYLLLPAVLLLGALAWWRRGDRLLTLWLTLALTVGGAVGPEPAQAQTAATATPAPTITPAAEATALPLWQRLWQRQDQQARAALEAGDVSRARTLATDAPTRGAAAFRASDFAAAAQAFDDPDDAEALYNRGTALARAGEYEEALKALDAALVKNPQAEDAIFNRQAILDFLERQKQQQQQQQQSQDGEGQESTPNEQAQDQAQDGAPQASQDQPGQPGAGESKAGQPGSQDKAGSQDSAAQPKQPEDADGSAAPKSGAEDNDATADNAAGAAKTPDEQAQQEASEAAKQAMQQALEANRQASGNASAEPGDTPVSEAPATTPLSPAERSAAEQQQALQQWLKRVPDDPGALLRRKFALEQQRRARAGTKPDDSSENPP